MIESNRIWLSNEAYKLRSDLNLHLILEDVEQRVGDEVRGPQSEHVADGLLGERSGLEGRIAEVLNTEELGLQTDIIFGKTEDRGLERTVW